MITTLERAVDCTHKEAIDFATTVDREVRINLLKYVARRSDIRHALNFDCTALSRDRVVVMNTTRV